MPSFAHSVAHMKNAHMREGPLRNTHLEHRTARHMYRDLIAQRGKAIRELSRWAQNIDDETVQHLLQGISELEVRSTEHERAYCAAYKLFNQSFRHVLEERQELNAFRDKVRAAAREVNDSRAKVEKQQRRLTMAAQDAPDLERRKSRAALAETAFSSRQTKLAALNEKLQQKLLQFQQSLHRHLRTAFHDLSQASMTLLQERACVEEEILKLLAMFPNVKGISEGQFVFEAFPDPVPADPIWHQGERFAQLLELERADAANTLDKEGRSFNQVVESLKAEAAAREDALSDELEKTKEYAYALERDLQSLRQQQVTNSLLQLQIGVQDASTVDDEGISQYIVRHVAMAGRAVAELLALMEKELEEEAELPSKASALSLTINATLLCAAGYAKYSKAENSLTLMPLVREIASASADFVALAVSRAPQISHFSIKTPNFSTLPLHGDPGMDDDSLPPPPPPPATMADEADALEAKTLPASGKGGPASASVRSSLFGTPTPGSASRMYLPAAAPAASSRRNSVADGRRGSFLDEPGERLRCDSGLFGFGDRPQQAKPESTTDEAWGWDAPPPPPAAVVPFSDLRDSGKRLQQLLTELASLVQNLAARDAELQGLDSRSSSELDKNVNSAHQMLEDGLHRIDKLQKESQRNDTGRLLETNQSMLKLSAELLSYLLQVIKGAQRMQVELRNCNDERALSIAEFSHKHKTWVDGFKGIAQETLEASPLLVEAICEVVKGHGKHEEMQVSVRAISAKTAQLIASSRTKNLAKGCTSKDEIVHGGSALLNTAQALLAAVRESYNLSLASVLMENYGNLSENQAKRLMMAKQVEVLRLEAELEREREKLGKLRAVLYVEG
eukprot:m.48801 g.48801  ORF g.48801 m.48801 type:complete len:851 (+) comp14985_c0_seq1:220-2772(+)